jgi:hypothetical protein
LGVGVVKDRVLYSNAVTNPVEHGCDVNSVKPVTDDSAESVVDDEK